MSLEQCMWCGAWLSAIQGPTHPYMESTPGCWAAFGRVLDREYSEPGLLEVHRLTVDAYAVQHPGQPERRSIQSVAVHLVRLCLALEYGLSAERANAAMLHAARHRHPYHWLQPPASLGPMTASDIDQAASTEEHRRLVRQWAGQMWNRWSAHHDTVRRWATAA